MGRAPCCSKVGLHRGPWSPREDATLSRYIQTHGEGQWRSLPMKAGLLRCGKSCRLRWMNYLRPDIKRGNIGPDEEQLILKLHSLLGNRWALIAGRLPGRTDNEIKNYWNTHLSKKLKREGIDPNTHKPFSSDSPQQARLQMNNTKRQRKSFPDEPKGTKVHLPKATRVRPNTPPPWACKELIRSPAANQGEKTPDSGGSGDHDFELFNDGSSLDSPSTNSNKDCNENDVNELVWELQNNYDNPIMEMLKLGDDNDASGAAVFGGDEVMLDSFIQSLLE